METADSAGGRAHVTSDNKALSKADRQTVRSLFAHPIARNLDWKDVLRLFTSIGTVEHLKNSETSIRIGTEHVMLRRPHSKDLTIEEIMALRHFMTRCGLSMQHPPSPTDGADFLITIDHHEARIYELDLRPGDQAEQVITPYDPHHFLRHLTHRNQTRQEGERAAEDPSFYERVAQAGIAAMPPGRIVIIGHGKGHSDAAHHLEGWIHLHHPDLAHRVACAMAADLSALTPPQLLVLARDVLAARD